MRKAPVASVVRLKDVDPLTASTFTAATGWVVSSSVTRPLIGT
jgi:hypothetical protein